MTDPKPPPTHDDRISNIAREHDTAVDRCDAYRFYADELNAKLSAAEAAFADMTARWEKADANYRFMVERAANEKLDGYR
jgi:hypothetical protein